MDEYESLCLEQVRHSMRAANPSNQEQYVEAEGNHVDTAQPAEFPLDRPSADTMIKSSAQDVMATDAINPSNKRKRPDEDGEEDTAAKRPKPSPLQGDDHADRAARIVYVKNIRIGMEDRKILWDFFAPYGAVKDARVVTASKPRSEGKHISLNAAFVEFVDPTSAAAARGEIFPFRNQATQVLRPAAPAVDNGEGDAEDCKGVSLENSIFIDSRGCGGTLGDMNDPLSALRHMQTSKKFVTGQVMLIKFSSQTPTKEALTTLRSHSVRVLRAGSPPKPQDNKIPPILDFDPKSFTLSTGAQVDSESPLDGQNIRAIVSDKYEVRGDALNCVNRGSGSVLVEFYQDRTLARSALPWAFTPFPLFGGRDYKG